jgi:hypothetical protein
MYCWPGRDYAQAVPRFLFFLLNDGRRADCNWPAVPPLPGVRQCLLRPSEKSEHCSEQGCTRLIRHGLCSTTRQWRPVSGRISKSTNLTRGGDIKSEETDRPAHDPIATPPYTACRMLTELLHGAALHPHPCFRVSSSVCTSVLLMCGLHLEACLVIVMVFILPYFLFVCAYGGRTKL